MKTTYCSTCRIEHDICECGEPIWKNPKTGRILDAHGDGKHRCPDSYWQKLLSKPIAEPDVRRVAQSESKKIVKRAEPVKVIPRKFTGGFSES